MIPLTNSSVEAYTATTGSEDREQDEPALVTVLIAAFIEEDALIIRFRTKKLEKQFQSGKAAIRAYGPEVAKRYVQRILVIQVAKDLEELKVLPVLNCHPLKGNRNGQWAVSLNGFYRLVFTVLDAEGKEIRVEEVSKHYDD